MCAIFCIYRGEDMQDGVNVPTLGGRIPDRDTETHIYTHTSVVLESESETHARTHQSVSILSLLYTHTNREMHQVVERYPAQTQKTIHGHSASEVNRDIIECKDSHKVRHDTQISSTDSFFFMTVALYFYPHHHHLLFI